MHSPLVSLYVVAFSYEIENRSHAATVKFSDEVVTVLLLKANPELKKVFEKLIKTMNLPVTWTDVFVIMNNNLILAGEIRSLIFSFDSRKVSTNIIEIPPESERLDKMPSDAMLNNVMNMTLYTFGKWGLISGLRVQKNYQELNALFEDVLRPVRIEPGFNAENFRFFKKDMQITYEDTMLAVMKLLKEEGKLKENQSLVTSEAQKDDADSSQQKGNAQDTPDSESAEEETYDYEIGLWHNLRWKKETCDFKKCALTDNPARTRIGNDFYITNYQCPDCAETLYMGVYPTDRELLIDTEEGRVFMTRTYACHNCNAFYTPRPGKLLQEGDVYSLKFDEDRTAYEDYLEVLGAKAARTNNYKFNEFEAERIRNKAKGDAAETSENTESGQGSPSFLSGMKNIKKRFSKSSEKLFSGNKRKQGAETANTDGSSISEPLSAKISNTGRERMSDAQVQTADRNGASLQSGSLQNSGMQDAMKRYAQGQNAQAKAMAENHARMTSQKIAGQNTATQQMPTINRVATAQNTLVQNTAARSATAQPIQTIGQGAAAQSMSAQRMPGHPENMQEEIARLSQKTTEELKNILSDLLYKNELFKSDHKDSISDSSYVGAVKKILQQKLTAKYDARMGALDNLSPKQLADLKKQLGSETALPEGKRNEYIKEINSRLYKAEEIALAQKIELSKKKTYPEIVTIIEDVEKRDIPDELKEDTLQKLNQIKNDRAKREVEYLLTHMPLHLDRKQLSGYLDKLEQYQGVDITPYRKQLEARKDMAEKEEISALIKRVGRNDRNALWKIYEQINQQDYKEENKAPFLEKLYDRVQIMDEMKIEKICPSIATLSFSEGLKAYEQINQGVFLPELKTNTLDMIQRRLTKLKTDEGVQLMRKLKHEMESKMTDCDGFYFYDAREELRLAQSKSEPRPETEGEEGGGKTNRTAMLRAINGYASARNAYEYPLMVCDTSRSRSGKEGYVLTPEHIFYHTLLNSGVIDITEVEKVHAGKKLFGKGIFIKCTGNGKEKLPNNVKPKNREPYAKVLDDFIHYLQEKPESRSLAYLSKEKHEVIHCYRCGHTYRTGNICPKCGSKMNR